MIAFRLSIVLAAIVIAWAIVGSAVADAPLPRDKPGCTDVALAKAQARELPANARVVWMNVLQSGAFIDSLNAYPPESRFVGDTVLVISRPDAYVRVIIFNGGCLSGHADLLPDVFAEVITKAERAML